MFFRVSGKHWLITLQKFQVCNFVIHHHQDCVLATPGLVLSVTRYLINLFILPPPPSLPETAVLFLIREVSYLLFSFYSPHEWNHTVLSLLYLDLLPLAQFPQGPSVLQMAVFHLSYGRAVLHRVCTTPPSSRPPSRHLGCPHVWGVVNNAAAQRCMCLYKSVFSIVLRRYPEEELMCHVVALFLIF